MYRYSPSLVDTAHTMRLISVFTGIDLSTLPLSVHMTMCLSLKLVIINFQVVLCTLTCWGTKPLSVTACFEIAMLCFLTVTKCSFLLLSVITSLVACSGSLRSVMPTDFRSVSVCVVCVDVLMLQIYRCGMNEAVRPTYNHAPASTSPDALQRPTTPLALVSFSF